MTHDKAVELAHHAMVNSKSRAHGLVDALIALNVVSYADKKPVLSMRLQDLMLESYGHGPYYLDQVFNVLATAKLELVERK